MAFFFWLAAYLIVTIPLVKTTPDDGFWICIIAIVIGLVVEGNS